MANRNIELGLRRIKSVGKTAYAKWVPMASLLILALTILYGTGASGGAEVSKSADQTNYANFQTVLRDQMHTDSELQQESYEAPQESQWHNFLIAIEIGVCMVLTFRLIVPMIGRVLERRLNPATTAEVKPKADAIQTKEVANGGRRSRSKSKSSAESAEQNASVLNEFFKAAPGQLVGMLKNFAQISRSTEAAVLEKYLGELGTEVTSLKNRVGSLELTPAWHVASHLQKLIDELREKPSHITPPTLRTTGSGLLLLKDLCMPAVRKDLVTEPPGRFMVVDDDPVSAQAVSACLKKVGQNPDLAENGEAALKLAEQQKYDAIFMDVEMPGLDGFEVCVKIHELATNRTTPVIFVTSVETYESRTKSKSSAKRDLIAKPFLTSEITLKAMVLLLRGRLEQEKARREIPAKGTPTPETKSVTNQVSAGEKSTADAHQKLPIAKNEKDGIPANQTTSQGELKNEPIAAKPDTASKEQKPDLIPTKAKETPAADLEEFVEHLRELQVHVSALCMTENAELRQELLSEVYVGLNMIRSDAARTGLRTICEVSGALGKLVSKLLDNGSVEDVHKIEAIAAAVQLLEELAQVGVEPDLANPPIRALVVDDEPLARRAVSNALQLTLDKPENAENGGAALALTQSKPFDVIFLDIMMPEMDGFETCSKIRVTKLNAETPIIFVTSSRDTDSRDKAFNCGGNGFITKPVLPAEIFLTALTSTLRSRMKKSKGMTSAEVLEEAVC